MKALSQHPITLLIFTIGVLSLTNCSKNDYNHKIFNNASTPNQLHCDITFGEGINPTLYEITIKCLNKESYTSDSIDLVSFRQLQNDPIQSIEILQNKTGYLITFQGNPKYQLSYPIDSKSHQSSVVNRSDKCMTYYNELVRLSYNMPSDINGNHRYVKVIGYSTIQMEKDGPFSLESFTKHSDNLFNIYKRNARCDHKWDWTN